MKWTPKDIIALVMILGAFVLRGLGIDYITEWIIVGVGGGYLGLGVGGILTKSIKRRRR